MLNQMIPGGHLPFKKIGMDQGVIKMFKAHYLQKSWCSLSIKCEVSLDELEKAAQAPERPRWNFRRAWCSVIGSPTPSMTPFGMSAMPGMS